MFLIPDINNIAPGVLDKLMNLYTNLRERKMSYEYLALNFKDKQMQRSIISLAQESSQYASEVCSQICCLGGDPEYGCDPVRMQINADVKNVSDEEQIGKICETSELKLVSLYKELLDDPFLFTGLRKMIQYQMNGFMFTISQLRLLQTSLYKS